MKKKSQKGLPFNQHLIIYHFFLTFLFACLFLTLPSYLFSHFSCLLIFKC
jgi:hypothetical protein